MHGKLLHTGRKSTTCRRRVGVRHTIINAAHHQNHQLAQINPAFTDYHRPWLANWQFPLIRFSVVCHQLVPTPDCQTGCPICPPPPISPSRYPSITHSRVFPNMELRGAGPKGRQPAQTILTSTMTRISTRPGSSNKSTFLQLQSIPPVLRPLVRAYLLGYASAVLPRLLTLVLQHLSNRRRKAPNYALPERDENTFLESAKHVLKTGLDPYRFPTFCAALVGGSTLLQVGHGLHDHKSFSLCNSINRHSHILFSFDISHTTTFKDGAGTLFPFLFTSTFSPHTFTPITLFSLNPVFRPSMPHYKPPQT